MSLLRPITEADFGAMFDLASDFAVVRGTGTWPWPAKPQFSRMRMRTPEAKAGKVLAIEVDGTCMGTIGLVKGELGYMLARKAWGRGIATRAVAEMLGLGFRLNELNRAEASVWVDNPASAQVLAKNGFSYARREIAFGAARGVDGPIDRYSLTRAAWAQNAPLRLETARLVIEPFQPGDAAKFAAQMNDIDVVQMMASIPHPFSAEMAAVWIAKRAWGGKPGFSAAVRLKSGALIGWIGMGGSPLSIVYAYWRAHWGQGYATEAGSAFLAEMQARFTPDILEAGAYGDNPASQRVLEKPSFAKIGEIVDKSLARLEPASLLQYRWRAAQQRGRGGDRNEIS